jgi:dihydrofolate synthase/folylpolyglutamate synthase
MHQAPLSPLAQSNLREWLSYIEKIHSMEIELGLTRVGKVAQDLGINFDFAQVITVAGTNGKGTSCAFLENALLSEHKSVAVYSSPHIEDFNERLRLNKENVDDSRLISAFERIERTRAEISLSYYEFTTLAALLILMDMHPDVIILEVGLGGRLDATNIIDADIAVITTIDLDHQAFLGDNRESIGREKAGIMRQKGLVVVGDKCPPHSLLAHGKALEAEMKVRDVDFFIEQKDQAQLDQSEQWQWRYAQHSLECLQNPHIPRDNVATALMVLAMLKIELNREKVNQWISATRVAGRAEMFNQGCDILLDVGHNPQASNYLADQIPATKYTKVLAVVGMLTDKDISSTLSPMHGLVDEWYLGALETPRAADAQQLAKSLGKQQNFNCFDHVVQAFKKAKQDAQADDLILVFGSFYTVAAIRRLLL